MYVVIKIGRYKGQVERVLSAWDWAVLENVARPTLNYKVPQLATSSVVILSFVGRWEKEGGRRRVCEIKVPRQSAKFCLNMFSFYTVDNSVRPLRWSQTLDFSPLIEAVNGSKSHPIAQDIRNTVKLLYLTNQGSRQAMISAFCI